MLTSIRSSIQNSMLKKMNQSKLIHDVCETHGPYKALSLNGHAKCPDCVLAQQKVIDKDRVANDLKNRGLMSFWIAGQKTHETPSRYTDASFDTYRMDNADQEYIVECLKKFCTDFKSNQKSENNIIMAGGTGTGKTHLAISTAKQIADLGFRTAYLTIFDLMKSRAYDGTDDIVSDLASYDLVILDEVGAHGDFGYSSDLVAATLFRLIEHRYANCKSTIIVTNIDVMQLKTTRGGLGDRAMDRLSDSLILKFFWESAR